jgi:uncharacterized membrane protein YdcZ (DUF606 family)
MTNPQRREASITEEDVRQEHHQSVNKAAHWAYLFGVLGVSFVLMIAFIAILGAGGS